jgi:hypothetical protein
MQDGDHPKDRASHTFQKQQVQDGSTNSQSVKCLAIESSNSSCTTHLTGSSGLEAIRACGTEKTFESVSTQVVTVEQLMCNSVVPKADIIVEAR